MIRSQMVCGILVRRERWGLSRKGWLLLALGMAALVFGLVRGAHPFLTVNNGGNGDIMVVEGWISSRRVDEAANAFRHGHYQRVLVVKNVSREGDKWKSGAYTADWVAADLVADGVPTNKVQLIFCPVVRRDRTYACAVAVRQWIEQTALSVKTIDVATLAVHTRRSRLLYEKAFGNDVAVRAIALPDDEYDADHWWRSSEGVREVPFELLAYLYVRFFFSPDTATVHFDTDQPGLDHKTTSSQPTVDRRLSFSRSRHPASVTDQQKPMEVKSQIPPVLGNSRRHSPSCELFSDLPLRGCGSTLERGLSKSEMGGSIPSTRSSFRPVSRFYFHDRYLLT